MEKVSYSQHQQIVRGKAWERFKKEHPLFDLIVPLGVGLVLGLIESFRIAGKIEPVIAASVTAAITIVIYCVLYIWYFSREHVFIYNNNKEQINSYIDKYEAKPIRVNIGLDEWEYAESISLGVTHRPIDPSIPMHTIISMVGIRVTNKEKNAELTNVYGSLNSLELRAYDGHVRVLFGEATRNSSLFSWSGGSKEGEVSMNQENMKFLKLQKV